MNKMECKRAPLEFLELTCKCETNLRRSGIDSINDLLCCSLKDLKKRKFLTKMNIEEIVKILDELGLTLRKDDDEYINNQ